MSATASDPDVRLHWLDSVSAGPAEMMDRKHVTHANILAADPEFYARLAAWYFDNGNRAVHRQTFVVCLVLGNPGQRDLGLALLHRLSVHELAGVLNFIHGHTKRPKPAAGSVSGKKPTDTRPRSGSLPGLLQRLSRLVARPATAQTPAAPPPAAPQAIGLFRATPRSLRTEITRYLRVREANFAWFDSTVLTERKSLKRLYALNHIKPSARAQEILFERNPPCESPLHARRQLARAARPCDQAKAIAELALPYRVAAAAIRQMTPTVLLTLVEQMTPADVLENLASLTRRGVMENAYLKGRVERKLHQAAAPCATAAKCCRSGPDILAEVLSQPLPRRGNSQSAGH